MSRLSVVVIAQWVSAPPPSASGIQFLCTVNSNNSPLCSVFIFLKPSVLNCDWRTWGITNLTCSFCVWDSFVFTSICSACQIQLVRVMLICVNSCSFSVKILGGSSRVVNSLDFYPASLKSLAVFTSSAYFLHQWKAVTINLQGLQCQL